MIVAEVVGRTLAALGVDMVFGVVGGGNFRVTSALVNGGARFIAARHEGGAATMADAYARVSGKVGVVSVHQGPGLTNVLTGLTEAAKSGTPLVVLAGEATDPRSGRHIDQDALAAAVGAVPMRVEDAGSAAGTAAEAYATATRDRRVVLLNLPLEVQHADAPPAAGEPPALPVRDAAPLARVWPDSGAEALAWMLMRSGKPVFVAGRGARHARRELEELADLVGALLATSTAAKGLFRGSPWDLDVSGAFSSPLTARLIRGADIMVAWGCSLNPWTTRHGALIGPGTEVVQVDLDPESIATHRRVSLGLAGDISDVAAAVAGALRPAGSHPSNPVLRGYRTRALADRIAAERAWRSVPYEDESGDGRIDPRTLTIALDDLLPGERIVATDSGNFMGYPVMFLDVPDEGGFCFTQGFESIGLGLATAVGAALARPDRLPVAAIGDGGALMGIAELETVVRLGLPMVIVVYDDETYGAEAHRLPGHRLETVTSPPADLASIARGYGCAAVTVTALRDLDAVATWLNGPRDRPLLVHAKITRDHHPWWLEGSPERPRPA
ncbi:thiamine pyrophosphate-binding protein [Nonomuraea jiangxiensis]|uniref:Acetolactate synthase large subunit n=1 Tax=Nonomuraea jiangxiensis TaxID=633440 RepID=A0A1G8URI0_9ACTN|nr:thiamine pyrophosphate-binding protein [Nonomuraea jiangxiensis]SDJ56398.1 Acetolactate synthase large subunit [Nonomuraea jiangxiensis]